MRKKLRPGVVTGYAILLVAAGAFGGVAFFGGEAGFKFGTLGGLFAAMLFVLFVALSNVRPRRPETREVRPPPTNDNGKE